MIKLSHTIQSCSSFSILVTQIFLYISLAFCLSNSLSASISSWWNKANTSPIGDFMGSNLSFGRSSEFSCDSRLCQYSCLTLLSFATLLICMKEVGYFSVVYWARMQFCRACWNAETFKWSCCWCSTPLETYVQFDAILSPHPPLLTKISRPLSCPRQYTFTQLAVISGSILTTVPLFITLHFFCHSDKAIQGMIMHPRLSFRFWFSRLWYTLWFEF